MNIKSPFFLLHLSIVLYSITMLIYGTMKFFLNADLNSISAFGSIMGGLGAFFAGIVGLYIFLNWEDQTNKLTLKEEAKILHSRIIKQENQNIYIGIVLKEIKSLKYLTAEMAEKYLAPIKFYRTEETKLLIDIDSFSELAEDKKLKNLCTEHFENLKEYKELIEMYEKKAEYPYTVEFRTTEESKRNLFLESWKKTKENIREYIILK